MADLSGYAETLKRLVPSEPAVGDEYVARDEENAGIPWDVPDRLRVIGAAGQKVRGLLHGAAGVGKSTELRHWERGLADVFEVAYVEVGDVRGGTEGVLRTVAERAGVVAVRDAVAARRVAAHEASRAFLQRQYGAAWTSLTYSFGGATARPVLLLVDGLDRLPLDAVVGLFGPGSPLFDDAAPSILYTAPHATLLTESRERWDSRITDIWHLPAFAIVNVDGTGRTGAFVSMAAGLMQRLSGLPVTIDPALLGRVVGASGGIPRHAVQLLRTAVLAASRLGRLGPHEVLAAERELRQDLEQALDPADITTLRNVNAGNWRGVPPHLLLSGAIIPYEGPERRYYRVHPLLASVLA